MATVAELKQNIIRLHTRLGISVPAMSKMRKAELEDMLTDLLTPKEIKVHGAAAQHHKDRRPRRVWHHSGRKHSRKLPDGLPRKERRMNTKSKAFKSEPNNYHHKIKVSVGRAGVAA